jgi:putative redox protein
MIVRLTAYWKGGYHVQVPVRGFEVVSDEPPDYSGEDNGPTPTELFLASLVACFAMAVAYAARKGGVELPDLQVTVDGDYEGLRFSALRLGVISTLARSELEPLVETAKTYCYVSNTLLGNPRLDIVIEN